LQLISIQQLPYCPDALANQQQTKATPPAQANTRLRSKVGYCIFLLNESEVKETKAFAKYCSPSVLCPPTKASLVLVMASNQHVPSSRLQGVELRTITSVDHFGCLWHSGASAAMDLAKCNM